GQRHDKARRAVAALRAMVFHERLLHRMQSAVAPETFDGHHMFAIELVEKLDAGVDGLVAEIIAFDLADQDRAGPAVAFGTDDLGAGQLQVIAEEVRQRGESGLSSDLVALAIHVKQHVIPHVTATNRSISELYSAGEFRLGKGTS